MLPWTKIALLALVSACLIAESFAQSRKHFYTSVLFHGDDCSQHAIRMQMYESSECIPNGAVESMIVVCGNNEIIHYSDRFCNNEYAKYSLPTSPKCQNNGDGTSSLVQCALSLPTLNGQVGLVTDLFKEATCTHRYGRTWIASDVCFHGEKNYCNNNSFLTSVYSDTACFSGALITNVTSTFPVSACYIGFGNPSKSNCGAANEN